MIDAKSVTAGDLASTSVKTVARHETLRVAVRRMDEHGIRCLLIPPDAPNRAIGVITTKDIVPLVATEDMSVLDSLLVEDAMTKVSITVPSTMCIADCVALMCMTGVRRLPVVDAGEIRGILSFTDVLRAIARG